LRFELPEGFRTRFEELLEASRELGWRASADSNGSFAFERVPAVPGSILSAVMAGYEHGALEAPLVPTRDLELVLAPPKLPFAGVLRGEVRDPSGAGVSGARVGLGLVSVVSDEVGRFEVPLARAVTAEVITAVKTGFLPARLERPGEPDADSSGWPDSVVLVLAGPALTIRGVVLDHEAQPVSGAKVWVHDPTPGAPIGMMPTHLEPLMAGAPVPPMALESEANLPSEDGDNFYDWTTNMRAPSALWHWVDTDATGHFELGGLDQRRYRLDVLRSGGLEVITSESLAAGDTSAVVRLGPPDVFERVDGRVLAGDGSPLPGVQVSLYRPMIDVRARIFGGNSQVVVIQPAGSVTTDADGRFGFDDVPKTGAMLSVRGDDIVPAAAEVASDSLDIRVELRCHLEVVLRDPLGRFDGISVADQDGKGLDILVLTEGSANAWTGVPLVQGRSGVVSVSSRARVLKLLKAGALVETRALDLVPGEVNRIEL
ncbi:MAG: carboxypeptidase regulatory-like domain-containing protein, partial [Planctomycetes bacterium]|nr:carboxypeptidase regulatory-like domain-containing protein [Planctomycetota bacterium]